MYGPVSGAFAAGPPAPSERYTLVERLGAGGMGQVWRAHDARLHRDVALKTVPLQADDALRARLLQEARIAAQLPSTGVVAVLDEGVLPDGRPFIVLELLEGPGLDGVDDLRRLVAVARAVGQAHALGIVHRDLKPANILLRAGHPVVIDWGLAKPVDERWSGHVLTATAPVTATGNGLGTVGFMAPEQLAGGPADPRSDVWSLAAILHGLVTGRPPNEGGGHGLLAEVVEGRLDVPRGPIGEVLRRGLAVEIGERYPDATRFADALEAASTARSSRGWGRFLIGGLAVLSGLAWWSSGAIPSDGSAADGWMLLAAGRPEEARQAGILAEVQASTPRGRGLLALPPPGEVVPLAPPCLPVRFDGDHVECRENGRSVVWTWAGQPTEAEILEERRGLWVGDDVRVVEGGQVVAQLLQHVDDAALAGDGTVVLRRGTTYQRWRPTKRHAFAGRPVWTLATRDATVWAGLREGAARVEPDRLAVLWSGVPSMVEEVVDEGFLITGEGLMDVFQGKEPVWPGVVDAARLGGDWVGLFADGRVERMDGDGRYDGPALIELHTRGDGVVGRTADGRVGALDAELHWTLEGEGVDALVLGPTGQALVRGNVIELPEGGWSLEEPVTALTIGVARVAFADRRGRVAVVSHAGELQAELELGTPVHALALADDLLFVAGPHGLTRWSLVSP